MVALDPLRICPLFSGLDEATLNEIALLAQEEVFHVNQPIYHANDEADRLYVLEAGEVNEYIAAGDPPGILVTTSADEGEVFGCSSLLAPRRHATSALCRRRTQALSLDAEALQGILDRDHSTGYTVARNLAEILDGHLRDARDQIQNMLSASSLGPGQPEP